MRLDVLLSPTPLLSAVSSSSSCPQTHIHTLSAHRAIYQKCRERDIYFLHIKSRKKKMTVHTNRNSMRGLVSYHLKPDLMCFRCVITCQTDNDNQAIRQSTYCICRVSAHVCMRGCVCVLCMVRAHGSTPKSARGSAKLVPQIERSDAR